MVDTDQLNVSIPPLLVDKYSPISNISGLPCIENDGNVGFKNGYNILFKASLIELTEVISENLDD